MELAEAKKVLNTLKNDMELCVSGWHGRLDRKETEAIDTVLNELEKVQKENAIKNDNLSMIGALGADYDGFEQAESLKGLIDDMVSYARAGMKNEEVF